jgi:hypothetical protein
VRGRGWDDAERDRVVAELRELSPEVEGADALWHALAAAIPVEPAIPDELGRIRRALLAQPRPRASPLLAWWREFGVMPGRAVGSAAATTAGVLALYAFAPSVSVAGHRLAWVGLAGPWLGVLWSLAVPPPSEGPWADWETMAPLGRAARTLVGLVLVAALAAVCAGLNALWRPTALSGGWPLLLPWAGPFSLAAVGAMALAWRWGTGTAVAVSTAVWGAPLVFGAAMAPNAWGIARWFMGYALSPEGGPATAVDTASFAAACLIAAWTVWGRGTWRSDWSRSTNRPL